MRVKQTIVTCLSFDGCAEEAANFYVPIFPNSKIVSTSRLLQRKANCTHSIRSVLFELDAQRFVAVNDELAAPGKERLSLLVSCERQRQVDEIWDRLTSDGGRSQQAGWLTDKFGVSWRIIPSILEDMIHHGAAEKAYRAVDAVWEMSKIDISRVIAAYDDE